MASSRNQQFFSSGRPLFPLLFLPLAFVFVMLLVMAAQTLSRNNFYSYGIFPRTLHGAVGILFAPFIHGDWGHFVSNAVPMLLLGFGVFYYFSDTAYRVFFWIFFATGLWVWTAARASYHIGSSGIVYGLATFLVVSALIKRNRNLLFFSLLVIFLYGSMVWGLFPVDPGISWESHLMGALSGIMLAIRYRNNGVEKEIPEWNEQDEAQENDESEANSQTMEQAVDDVESSPETGAKKDPVRVVYHYRAKGQEPPAASE